MIKNHLVREVKRTQEQAAERLEPRRDFVKGFIRSFKGSIRVPGHPNKVWFQELGMPESIIPVVNHAVQDLDGLPVIVGWDIKPPYAERKVIGVDTVAIELQGGNNAGQFDLPNHAQTHEWITESDKGSDPIRIWSPALRPGKTLYTGASLDIVVYAANYMWNNEVVMFNGKRIDLTPYVPDAGLKRYVVTGIDKAARDGVVIEGETVGSVFGIPEIPTLPPDFIPSALILLTGGDTGVTPAMYRDLRSWLGDDIGSLALPTKPGQIMYTVDGVRMRPETPVVADGAWLMNDDGIFIVEG